jgi:hypothetical protein
LDRERPYFGRALLCVEPGPPRILLLEVVGTWTWHEKVLDGLLGAIEQVKTLPNAVWVRHPDVRRLLAPAMHALGVELQSTARLESLEAVEDELSSLGSGDFVPE